MARRNRSIEIFNASKKILPGGVNSPVRALQGLMVDPIIVDRGAEDIIVDIDGNKYIDFCMSWGALLHGHAYPSIVSKVHDRINRGTSFGISTKEEQKYAEKIVEGVSSVEMLRFVSSGTEAVMSALRLARGFTNKDLVIKFDGNYHGHADPFLVKSGSGLANQKSSPTSLGVPKGVFENTISLPYNDLEVFSKVLSRKDVRKNLAAIVIEPIAANMGVVPADHRFLKLLRQYATDLGAVLIFDEVISGFRVAKGGAESLYDIYPDLSCFGKIIGGGFPAAAFGGKKKIMEFLAPLGTVYQAGTLSGNPVAMEAGMESFRLLEQPSFYKELDRKTKIITKPVEKAISGGCIQSSVGMFTLFFGVDKVKSFSDLKQMDSKLFAQYFRFMLSKGIYISPSPYEACFISMAHSDKHLEHVRDLILKFIDMHKDKCVATSKELCGVMP